MIRKLLILAAATLTLTACRPKPPKGTYEDLNRQPQVRANQQIIIPPDPTTLADISGAVTLKGTPPKPLPLDVSMDPGCVTPGAPAPVAQQYVLKGNKLANVFVYVKAGPLPAMTIPANFTDRAVIDQKGCIYTPHVVAIMRGGYVEFRNSDHTMHTIDTMPTTAGNRKLDLSQGPNGEPKDAQFAAAENMIPVRCSLHPWMNAFVNVSASPFFDVTDADGKFNLPGLPAGDYTIAAVHEILGEQTFHLTVAPKSSAHADFAFTMVTK